MKILIIKLSSMGDIAHLFPAIDELKHQYPEIQIDWVVESAFVPLVELNNHIETVLPISLRSWKKSIFKLRTWLAIAQFIKLLRKKHYTHVIDAQGLIKSAIVAILARGKRFGFDKSSAREPVAAYCYQKKISAPYNVHAIMRLRLLFAKIFAYTQKEAWSKNCFKVSLPNTLAFSTPYFIFLHGTTWSTKHLPIESWKALGFEIAQRAQIYLPWYSKEEQETAKQIYEYCHQKGVRFNPKILPRLELKEVIAVISHAQGVFAVDTGLSHIAGALGKPIITIYGATDPALTGVIGVRAQNIFSKIACAPCLKKSCAVATQQPFPCYQALEPNYLWSKMEALIQNEHLNSNESN